MYVCLCNGYRDEEIREVAESGVRCAREAYLTLGNGPCCGTCLDCAQEIVDNVHTPAAAKTRPQPELAPEAAEALLMAAE
ncbi:(2Fe-2S)-binding protein [Pelagibius marinus]|uniref:(2Fe-2S)-binding protein n=1 Tax=Pelagibius marinus TaxID=2762760 RepID=UPI0018722D4B|nr:(2Fe-2S)-binding protein [Pelagibius marinus]